MSAHDPKKATDPDEPQTLVRDAAEDTGIGAFAEPGGSVFGEDSVPSLLLIDTVDENENSTPSLGGGTDTPLDPDSIALFGK